MTAGEVIELLIQASGRDDLVSSEGVPSASLWFHLNSAQRMLDRDLGYPKEDAWLCKTVPAGETLVTFKAVRYVKGVYYEKTPINWKPVFFDIEYVPEEGEEESHWPVKAIEINASDEEREIKILAAWHSESLSDEEDISFWTVQEPNLLILATMYQFEVYHRNTQGQNDFIVPIKAELKSLYNDMIAEQMEGSPDNWRIGVYDE